MRLIKLSDISAAVIDNLQAATMSDDQLGLAATMDVFPTQELEREEAEV